MASCQKMQKVLEKCWQCVGLTPLSLPAHPLSITPGERTLSCTNSQPDYKKIPHMFKPYLLLEQSSNSSIINLLLGATNTPGSLVCKYLAKTAVMKLTASVSGRLQIPREAAHVQNHSRWKRSQQKSTATVNVCTKDIIDQQNESCLNRHRKIGEKTVPRGRV